MSVKNLFSPNFESACVNKHSTISETLQNLNSSGLLISCIVDEQRNLIGIVNDSDIRRSFLKKIDLNSSIMDIVNINPFVLPVEMTTEEILHAVDQTARREIPLIDKNGMLQDIFVLGISDERQPQNNNKKISRSVSIAVLPNTMFVLAGGLGTRLRSVVSDRPKPLALIGDRPILELLMRQAHMRGINKFILSINYMGEMIESYFSPDRFPGFQIDFVKESQPLGTAGSIGNIAEVIESPLLVANADVLTNVPFEKILKHHVKENSDITCVVRNHHFSVPFGVVDLNGFDVVGVREKPSIDLIINAGIYVLSPQVCRLVKKNAYLDMPDLIKLCLTQKMKVSAFPLHEYWLDVGKPEDYKKANEEFEKYFEGNCI